MLVWRASISTRDFYQRINVGPFATQIRDMIRAGDQGEPETFAVTLAKFGDERYFGILNPHPERWADINYVRFYLSGFVAHVKVDRQPPPDLFSSFVIRPGVPISVLYRSKESKDGEVFRAIARASANWKRHRR